MPNPLLILNAMVPWAQLRTWSRALSFDSAPGNLAFSYNVHHCLEGSLFLCYKSLNPAAEEITAAIDEFLCM